MSTGHSDTTTEGIRIRVGATYLADRSHPESGEWVFQYHVLVDNVGDQASRLEARHWVIKDADNQTQEVRGQGVVGQQPRIEPGESFEYQSICPLTTSWGTMEGSYTMKRDDGVSFEAEIGRFFLAETVEPFVIPDEASSSR